MDNFKWPAIAFIGVALASAISSAFESYSVAIETKAAMESGYEQVENENGTLVWRPCESQ